MSSTSDDRTDRLAEWIRALVMGGEYVGRHPWADQDDEARTHWRGQARSALRALDGTALG